MRRKFGGIGSTSEGSDIVKRSAPTENSRSYCSRAERSAGAGQVLLTGHLVQGVRAHPYGKRRGSVLRFPRCRVEQALHLAITRSGHTPRLSVTQDTLTSATAPAAQACGKR